MLKFSVIVFFQLSSFCNSKIDIYCCKFFSLLWPPMMFFTPTRRAHAHSKKNKIYTQTFKGDGECSSDSVLQNMLSQWTKPTAVYNYRFTALCVCDHGCVCVFGRCLTFLFFSFDFTWPQFTCRLPLNVASPYKYPHVHMHTQKRQHTLYLLLPICAPAYISCLPLTLSYLHTHTHHHTQSSSYE